MSTIDGRWYVPSLRGKRAEYESIGYLDDAVKEFILPCLLVPPPKHVDQEKGRPLALDEVISVHNQRILMHWGPRPCLVDLRFVPVRGERTTDWVREFLEYGARSGTNAIPVIPINIDAQRLEGFRNYVRTSGCDVAIRLTLSDLDEMALTERLNALLSKLSVDSQQVVIQLDLAVGHFGNAGDMATFSDYWTTLLQGLAKWQGIVVLGSNYPRENPAKPNSEVMIERLEWLSWLSLREMHSDADRAGIVFGDYGADHGAVRFEPGGRAVKHLRYATTEGWRVVRGGERNEGHDGSIFEVARRIARAPDFAGELFSRGDEQIADLAANRVGPGTATDWRRANMNHHMTRVVADISAINQTPLPGVSRRREQVQQALFGEGKA